MQNAVKDYSFCFAESNGGSPPGSGGKPGGPPGQKVLRNPDPFELGKHADDIRAGKIRIEHDT